jgi:uncharacterized protein YhbP (UPF0306 family)
MYFLKQIMDNNNFLDPKIVEFIKEHHVLTLATSRNNEPYCANCFYAYIESKNVFVFTSDLETKHVKDFEFQNKVAASIVLETSIIGKIQGLQITGKVELPKEIEKSEIQKAYLKKYPFAVIMKTHLWVLTPDFYKFTDNRLGFGKKVFWQKP